MRIRRMIGLFLGACMVTACSSGGDGGAAGDASVVEVRSTDTGSRPDSTAMPTTSASADGTGVAEPPVTEAPVTEQSDTTALGTTGVVPEIVPLAGSIHESFLGDPYLGPLTYRAFPQCSVPVREKVVRKGAAARIEYRLRFTPEGDNTVIAWTEMEVLTIDGMPVPQALAEAATAAFLMPEIVVDESGRAVETRGAADVVAQIAEFEPDVAEFLESPQMLAALEARAVDRYWYSWAGIWANWGSFEEPIEEAGYVDEAGDPQTLTMTSMGTIGEDLAAFSLSRVVEGDDLLEMLSAAVDLVAPDESLPTVSEADTQGQMTDTIEVVTDPTTLWPRSALVERRLKATFDGERVSVLERHESVLDWESSDCM